MWLFCPFHRWSLGFIERLSSSRGHLACPKQWFDGNSGVLNPIVSLNHMSSLRVLGDTVLKTHLVLEDFCRVINLFESKHTLFTVHMNESIFGNSQGALNNLKTTMFKLSWEEKINRNKERMLFNWASMKGRMKKRKTSSVMDGMLHRRDCGLSSWRHKWKWMGRTHGKNPCHVGTSRRLYNWGQGQIKAAEMLRSRISENCSQSICQN